MDSGTISKGNIKLISKFDVENPDCSFMESYLEFVVPIAICATWYNEMLRNLRSVPVKWQGRCFHITVVFVNDAPAGARLLELFNGMLSDAKAPTLFFDKLDAFTTTSGSSHIINLTTTVPSAEFLEMVEGIRSRVEHRGCDVSQGFRIHVTLGRVAGNSITIKHLRSRLAGIHLPPFEIRLTRMRYLQREGHRVIGQWTLK